MNADMRAVRHWLTAYYRDAPGRIHIASTGDWTGRSFTDVDQAADYISALDQAGREGIYHRATTLRAPLTAGQRGGAGDSRALPGLWADIDIAGPGHKTTEPLPGGEDAAQAIVTAAGLPAPTVWVHSGGGLYPWWLISPVHPIGDEDLDRVKALSVSWHAALGKAAAALGLHYGTGVSDLARVLRVPGTINRKAGLARPARLLSEDGPRYTFTQLQDIVAALPILQPPPDPPPPNPPPGGTRWGTFTSGSGPFDALSASATWAEIFAPMGWEHVGTETDGAQLWKRPGATSEYSARCDHGGIPTCVVHSDAAGLPAGPGHRLTKGKVWAWFHHHGNYSAAAKDLLAAAAGNPAASAAARALPPHVLAAVKDQCGVTAWTPPAKRPDLNVSNAAVAADWLRDAIGAGPLAGMFLRGPVIVHTPREGQDGYVPLTDRDGDVDGPAQVRPVVANTLASRVQFLFDCYRVDKEGNRSPAMFPTSAARVACDVPDMLPNLRVLRGVVHTPVVRPDGTVVTTPGYDDATHLLYLPEPGLTVPDVPERPTPEQVADAVALLEEMTGDFRFLTDHDRANYYGLLLTPLLRAMCPPPYKLGAIGAPQPGSGKSLLASILRIVHGGVFRSEIPGDDAELGKQITSILTVTTGPVVEFDNVSGTLRSSKFAGLLTSARWEDRPLGSTDNVVRPNDRLWIITGNNLSLGGDLPRRTLWVTIDPAVPDPHLRTGFHITNLTIWAKDNRGRLLHALLTLVRNWVAAGRPTPDRGNDGFAAWVEAVDGILTAAGVPGTFDHAESTRQSTGTDDAEWGEFLAVILREFGDRTWTVRELLDKVDASTSLTDPSWASTHPIPLEALPAELADKIGRSASGARGIARSLGMWLRNREGRWADRLTVRSAGKDRKDAGLWRVEAAGTSQGAGTSPGTQNASTSENNTSAGTAGTSHHDGRQEKDPDFFGADGVGSPGRPGSPGTCPTCHWPTDSQGHASACPPAAA